MTVSNKVPAVIYTANGSIDTYFFDWDMLPESVIHVRLDDTETFDFVPVPVNGIRFNTAPTAGTVILIYRQTPVHQPEDYEFARGFKSSKTELSMDRLYMLTQEDREGYTGSSDLSVRRSRINVTVVSGRGTDAVIQLWSSDIVTAPPDASIIWAGPTINSFRFGTNDAFARFLFLATAVGGQLGQANVEHYTGNLSDFTSWLDHETTAGNYFIRIVNVTGDVDKLKITRSGGAPQDIGDEFEAVGAEISLTTVNDTPPVAFGVELNIEISADDGGVPDGSWVSRHCTINVST